MILMKGFKMKYYSTRDVGKIVEIKPGLINKAIWDGTVDPPQKSPSGSYLWTKGDIERLAWQLHLKIRRDLL